MGQQQIGKITNKSKDKNEIKQYSQDYQIRNAYTLRLCRQQIITVIVFLIQVIFHQIMISPQCNDINEAILWTMFGFRYFLLLMVIYDYLILTIRDPVDRLIIDQKRRYKHKQFELRYCNICQSNVQRTSHHCMACNRCTQNFDHHCKYLNNCIGVQNYQNFIRLLISYIIYIIISIGMALYIIILNQQNQYKILNESYIRKWIIIAYIIFTSIIAIFVAILLLFHLYISCCANMTTKQYIYQDLNKQFKKQDHLKITIQPAPLTAEIFNLKQNKKTHKQKKNHINKNKHKHKQQQQQQQQQQYQQEDLKKIPNTNHTDKFYQPMQYYRK